MVYDGVGKDTWEISLDCIEPRGLMVSFGNASGPVTGVNVGILNQKGLPVSHPAVIGHARQYAGNAEGRLRRVVRSGAEKKKSACVSISAIRWTRLESSDRAGIAQNDGATTVLTLDN